MSERQIKEYYERIEKLLNGANKETYGFAPQEIKNILRSYEELQNQNQELKKQLEETNRFKFNYKNDKTNIQPVIRKQNDVEIIKNLENQQKEFINKIKELETKLKENGINE